MFKQMLAKQRITFVSDVNQAMKHSPFYSWHNPKSGKYVVSRRDGMIPVAAGLEKDEAEACVMFKANEHIMQGIQKRH